MQLTATPKGSSGGAISRTFSHVVSIPHWILPFAILCLGFGLRLFRINDLSLWVDEVYTVEYSRLSWYAVLGFEGAYDNHPPGYYTLVKVMSLAFSDTMAARALSLVTGAATIPVMYVLVRHLVNRNAALLSSLILAISPLHIWYSQDGRMYAPTAFAVACSYVALIKFLEQRTVVWGVGYGFTLLLAMLQDYSALYGLAPQVVIVGYVSWKARRVPREWLVVSIVTGLLYLPWVTQIVATITELETRDYLIVTRAKIFESSLTVMGLPGESNYYWGVVATPWSEWPQFRPFAIAIVAALLFLSSASLCGRYRLAFVTGAALLVGTIASAALMSYFVSPGYADRTVLFAVLGWVVLAGSAPFGRVPNGARFLSLSSITALLVFSMISLINIYDSAQKEPFESAANVASSGAVYGIPIYADDFMYTAITSYHPDVVVRPMDEIGRSPALIHTYGDYTWREWLSSASQGDLAGLGYERVLHQKFDDPWSTAPTVDLYIRKSASIGESLPTAGWPANFSRNHSAAGWQILGSHTEVEIGPSNSRELVIFGSSSVSEPVRLHMAASEDRLYILTIDYWLEIPAVGMANVMIECRSAEGETLAASQTEFRGVPSATQIWQRARAGIMCGEGTESLYIALENPAVGEVRLRTPRLAELRPFE
ncbi:hypothetical protein BH23CHL5_BH23CHL5_06880 [soil metagenome]